MYAILYIVYHLKLGSILSTGQGQALAESCFCAASRLSKKDDLSEHTILVEVYKNLDATELCGTRHKAARFTRPLQLGPKTFELMRESFVQQRRNDEQETEKAPFLVVRKVRDAILDETFKPGDHLPEAELAEMFEVSRSPVREALLALEKEGTVMMEPYIGATVKPLSPEEALDIAELRLPLITLAAKLAHRHLSPADFDLASGLAKQATRSKSAKEHFEYNRRFWDIIFEKTQRPILWEVFRHWTTE